MQDPTNVFAQPTAIASASGRPTRKYLLIAAFIFLGLLSISLLIAVIVQGKSSKKTDTDNSLSDENFCLTQGCISAATHQLRAMDSTAASKKCDDFYSYACGGWQRTHPLQSFDVERTVLDDILRQRDEDIERLLDAPIPLTDTDGWEYKVKTYYAECLDDFARVPDSGKLFLALIQEPQTIDGWFVFDNSVENASQEFLLKNQTVYQQLSHIHGDLGALAIFGLRARFDELDPSVKRLEFYPAGLTMEVSDYLRNDTISEQRRVAYQLYIVEVLGILAQDAGISDGYLGDRTFTVANDVYTVERFLAETLADNPTQSKPTIRTIADMTAQFSFDFTRLIAHELEDSTIDPTVTPVYISNMVYFTNAFEYLDKNDDPLFARMIHNYLRWRLLSTYIEDLSYSYDYAHRVFIDAYYNYPLHESNEEHCAHEVTRRFPLAIQRLYTRDSVRFENLTLTIEALVVSLTEGFGKYIDTKAAWMADEDTKKIAREKVASLVASIGYVPGASNDRFLNDYYKKFDVTDDSHFKNAYNYHRFRQWILSVSLREPNLLDHWDLFETRTSRLFDYVALFNRLFVIASGMHEPLVGLNWPWPMNMGSIGVLLAQKLFASIDGPEGRTHLANGTRSDWWASPTIVGYNNSRNCITDYYVNTLKSVTYDVSGTSVQVQLTGEPFSPTTLRHIGALRLAYDVFKEKEPEKPLRLPGTDLTSEQTFFLAYAQTQCHRRDGLLQVLQTQLGFYDEGTALNAALFHMPEFARAFQCPVKDKQCF